MKNRILLYVHFNKLDQVSDHVRYQLRQMKDLYKKVVFISNSQISEADKKSLKGLYDEFLQRENSGFDFAAWRDGMELIGWKELVKFDDITLMNDTCFGPIYPMSEIYEEMENHEEIDFWGITDHGKMMNGMPGTNAPTPKHIQSYFTCYNKKVVKSKTFQDFWNNVKDYEDVHKVIQDYETALTGILEKAGFESGSYFDTKKYSAENSIVDLFNYSELAPLILIEEKAPFVKIKAFSHTSYKDMINLIKSKTHYPVKLITDHIKKMNLPTVGSQEFLLFRAKRKAAHLMRSNKAIMKIAKQNPEMVKFAKKVARKITGGKEIMIIQHAPVVPQLNKNELTFNDVYDPNHAIRKAEHEVLLANNKTYYYEKESDKEFVRDESDPRVVAIYLPQYHPFPENDKAWGKGFTEWTNVTSSIPRFVGQEQPVLSSDLGFYDLRIPGKMKEQIDLAKKYGMYGFQFYYYWFSGKKVMEFPIEEFYKNKDLDFKYSICWANENWTRRWDGSEDDVIFEQKNSEGDPLKFIKDVAHHLNDERYIQENGRPVLTVYRVDLLDDPQNYAKIWRDYFRKEYGKELWLIGCTNFKNFTPEQVGFDALMDMTPTNSSSQEIKPWVTDKKHLNHTVELLDKNWSGVVLDYRYIAKEEIKHLPDNINDYKTISPSWCNEARRKGVNGFTFYKSSPEIFAHWLDKILDFDINVKKKKSPLVFINAWNEWAEAAMLEPSVHLGHNTLRRVSEVIAKYSKNKQNKTNFPAYQLKHDKKAKLAVIVHLFYPNMWMKIAEKLANISEDFDLYITVSDSNKNIEIPKVSQYHKNTNIIVVPNRGRDVLPFLTVAGRIRELGQYEYLLKLHTKKSLHRKDGAKWLDELLSTLLPENTNLILEQLNDEKTGAIGPQEHIVSLSKHMGSNAEHIKKLLLEMDQEAKIKSIFKKLDKYPYFGGTMFWCRMDYLDPLLDLFLMPSDFESEKGQIDGTMAHAVERILGKILHEESDKTMYQISEDIKISKVKDKSYDEIYKYAK